MTKDFRPERDGPANADDFDRDLERANDREPHGHTMEELAHPGDDPRGPFEEDRVRPDVDHRQHARRGQAESPVEATINQPPKHQQGHD